MAEKKQAPEPLSAISRALSAKDGEDRKPARRAASELLGAWTWDRLPARFKSVVRADIAGLGEKPTLEAVMAAGYSAKLGRQALRDLGHG